MSDSFPNPLRHLHEQAEAEFQEYGPIDIVSTFGEPQAEYAAVHKACAMMDLPQRGFLELTGRDRASFLNALVTNQTFNKETKTGLAAGEGVYAFLLNNKGRIIVDLNILELGERMLLEMDARLVEQTRATLDRYLFAEQVKMANVSPALHEIALHGPGAEAVLRDAAGGTFAAPGPQRSVQATLFGRDVIVWRDDQTGHPGYMLICKADDAAVVWQNLQAHFGTSDQLGKRRLRALGWAAYNACRIEGGRPLFGIDFDDTVLPAETGLLDRAVSFTKGCYVGQEIVARMHGRGVLARKLVGIRMENDALPIAGAKCYDEAGNEVGGITSSTLSPVLSNTAVALGYLKKPFFAEGTVITIPAEGAMRKGTVVPLPFLGR